MSQSPIIFIHASLDKSQPFPNPKGPYRWIFFGQDYVQYLKWQQRLEGDFEEIKIDVALDDASSELRKPFIDLIVDLGKKKNSIAWWASRVSERNTLVSSLFLYCCYQRIFEETLNNQEAALLVIGEDWSLLEALSQLALKKGRSISWASRIPGFVKRFQWGYKAFGRVIKAMARGILLKSAGPGIEADKIGTDTYLIHTYIDDACFSTDGNFSDRYFPKLYEWLEKNGMKVVNLPVLVNVKGSPSEVWKRLKSSGKNFINPYFYYGFSDYTFTFAQSLKQQGMFKEKIDLNGMDVRYLFEEESNRYLFGTIESLLYYRLPQRLLKAGINFKEVITPFENMLDEKMFILGLRQFVSSTRITAFQHSPVSPMVLCLFVSEQEAQFSPLPDKIICNGDFSKRIFIQEGLPADRLRLGPALRQAGHDQENKNVQSFSDVLVVVPLMESDALELLKKVIAALGDIKDVKVAVKLHPMMRQERILAIDPSMKIPEHFQFVQGSLRHLLAGTKLVLTMGSTSIIEIFAFGVPILVVGRQAAINFNPLAFLPEFKKVFTLPLEIRREALRLLTSPEIREEQVKRGKEMATFIFNPVSETAMQEFL